MRKRGEEEEDEEDWGGGGLHFNECVITQCALRVN